MATTFDPINYKKTTRDQCVIYHDTCPQRMLYGSKRQRSMVQHRSVSPSKEGRSSMLYRVS